jgi:hypothetical protein
MLCLWTLHELMIKYRALSCNAGAATYLRIYNHHGISIDTSNVTRHRRITDGCRQTSLRVPVALVLGQPPYKRGLGIRWGRDVCLAVKADYD